MLESLANIKDDLENTASHFERLSETLTGHLIFSRYWASHLDDTDITGSIQNIESVVDTLRTAAAKLR